MFAAWECPAIGPVNSCGRIVLRDRAGMRRSAVGPTIAGRFMPWGTRTLVAAPRYGVFPAEGLGTCPSFSRASSFLRISGKRLSGGFALVAAFSAERQADFALAF